LAPSGASPKVTLLALEAKRTRIQCFYKRLDVNLKIPRIRFTESRPEIFTKQELDALLSGARGRRYWLFKTFLQSGLRRQEMEHVEYSNLLDNGVAPLRLSWHMDTEGS
jgi:integrase